MKKTEIKNETLTSFVRSCKAHIAIIDCLMREHESKERGSRIVKEMNRFEMDVDRLLHFDMGLSFDEIKKILRHDWKYKGLKNPKK